VRARGRRALRGCAAWSAQNPARARARQQNPEQGFTLGRRQRERRADDGACRTATARWTSARRSRCWWTR